MSQSKFELNVANSELPVAKPKIFKYAGSAATLDVYQTHKAIGKAMNIINTDTTNSISVSVDDLPEFTLLAGMDIKFDFQFTKLDVTGSGTADFIIEVIPETLYARALKKLAEVD